MPPTSAAEHIICSVLRGESIDWPESSDPTAISQFIAAGRYDGVLPLLDAQFQAREELRTWPKDIVVACHKATLAQGMHEAARREEIVRVIGALVSAGVKPLLLKGSPLAYSHYSNPSLRPRADTDLLISIGQRNETAAALERLGYSKAEAVAGELISYQASWSRPDPLGIVHHLDVHWRVSNSQIFAKIFSYDELAMRSVPIPALGVHAFAPAPVDALLFACFHRAKHISSPHSVAGLGDADADRLIWLYDIHLLITRMSDRELDEFAALAAAKEVKSICHDALLRTSECFGTPIEPRVLQALNRPGPIEPSARYLSGGRARQMFGDFVALERWGDRGRWLKELALPSAGYMRGKYPEAANTWLPILYVRRGLTGIRRLIFSRGAGHEH